MNEEQILDTFRETGALLEGHFILRSGKHSRQFFQCALLLEHAKLMERLCGELVQKVEGLKFDRVISPAMGGLFVGQEMARQLGKRHIFVEKVDGKLGLRRGFAIERGEKFLVCEDVATEGGRVIETMEIVENHGAEVAGVALFVDRSTGRLDFECPTVSLLKLPVENFEPDHLPADLKKIPAVKPGSK
jgi:orotate phosphoribosyltransferase